MSRKKRSVHRYTPYTPIYSTSNDLPDVSSWVEWKQFYQRELANDKYGYETKFIDLVLSHVNNIIPSDVRYQYHFRDGLLSKNRYIDFLILNKDKGYCLAIELDGYGKMLGNAIGDNKDYDKFNDFIIRQNSLLKALYKHDETSKFNIIILRYTNKYFLNNTQNVISEILNTLYLQINLYKNGNKLVTTLDDYRQQIEELQNDVIYYKKNLDHAMNLIGTRDNIIKEMETEIAYYQHQVETASDTVSEINEASNPSTNPLFEPSEIILANNQLDGIKDDCEDKDYNTDISVLRIHLTDTGYAFEDLTEKDLLIEKLKSENAKLKWIEMKYKELTEPNYTKEKDLEVVKRNEILRVMAEESLRDTDETVSQNEIIFTQKEKEALAEVFKNSDEIDWNATRTALSKQPNRLKRKETKVNHPDDDTGIGLVFYTIIGFVLLIILLVAMEK